VRNAFASIELIETFLNRRHKLNALRNLFERAVIRQSANRFKYDLFLCHGADYEVRCQIAQERTISQKSAQFERKEWAVKKINTYRGNIEVIAQFLSQAGIKSLISTAYSRSGDSETSSTRLKSTFGCMLLFKSERQGR
jgi:hypothetical protein